MGEPGRRVLDDRYELDELIASGGMGQVWRGRDTRLGRPVAVKLLRSEYTGDPTFLARFRAEAHHAAALSHPNIAAVYDYGEATDVDGEHLAYLVMELVQGEPLSTRLEEEGPLSPEATLSVLRQAAVALAEAHHVGLVHRDVKPGNILVEPGGRVKITDFGIAWSAGSVPLTEAGQVLGSPQYLPPELAVGNPPSPASDVYSLGLVGYECLTGQPAFDGENPVTIALKQVQEEPEPLPADLPPGLRELVDVAVAKDPGERIPDGDAFVAAVDRIRAGHPIEAGHDHAATTTAIPLAGVLPSPVPGGHHDSDRHPPVAVRRPMRWVVPAVAALLLVTGLAAVLGLTRGGGLPEAAGTGTSRSAAVVLAAEDYVGRPVEDVVAQLTGLGLTVEQLLGDGTAAPGTVTQLDPVGRELRAGDVVTVYVAGEELPVPAGPASVAPVGDPADGATTPGRSAGGGTGVGSAARAGSAAGTVPATPSGGRTPEGTTDAGATAGPPTGSGTTETGTTETGTTETGTTETGTTETGTTETGATPPGTTEAEPSVTGSTEVTPTETESEPTETGSTGSEPTESQPTGSEPTGTEPTGTEPTGTAATSAAPGTGSGTPSSDAATPPSDPGTATG